MKHSQPKKAIGLGGCSIDICTSKSSTSLSGLFHSVIWLRTAAHGIWVILATSFHLQRLQHSKVYSYSHVHKDLLSFPYTRQGKELKKKLLSSLAQTSGCGAAPSGLLSETAGSTALLHLPALWHISAHICCKRAVCSLSRAWENQQGQQRRQNDVCRWCHLSQPYRG